MPGVVVCVCPAGVALASLWRGLAKSAPGRQPSDKRTLCSCQPEWYQFHTYDSTSILTDDRVANARVLVGCFFGFSFCLY